MSNYTNLAEALNNYLNEVYRHTNGNNELAINALAEIIEAEIGIKDAKKLYYALGKEIEEVEF